MNMTSPPTRAYLHGLAEPLNSDLKKVLKSVACDTAESPQQAQIVFCAWDPQEFQSLRSQFGTLPVVVVSRVPDMSGWLDALEAGASDYCAAPFESIQLRWILDAHLRHPLRSAAA
ncbi:MAG TPA: hypothetical protein PKJ41_12710 [Bryobacteraceae bacterium]|nr:hypothetical protein [Bryobacteraceae bacterium]HPT25908.1 hypothetical protein [Bryobacteraceae bacterium]